MSTPDARLNAAERAALADLEAAATAADPSLAARLKGSATWHPRALVRPALAQVRRAWALVLGLRWWGVPVFVAGILLALLGLSTGLAVSFAGVVLVAVGLRVLAEMVISRRPG